MKKYFSLSLITTFIIATIFLVTFFIPQAQVKAQSTPECTAVEAFLSSNPQLSLENANAVRTMFGCPIPVTPVATSTPPQAEVVITIPPVLNLVMDKLQATYRLAITAGDEDLNFYPGFGRIDFVDENNKPVYVNSSAFYFNFIYGATVHTDIYGNNYYTVSAGETARVYLAGSVKPEQLFAGNYYATLTSLTSCQVATANGQAVTCSTIPVPANRTDAQYIVGEKSPYISEVSPQINNDGTTVLGIYGARLLNATKFGQHVVCYIGDNNSYEITTPVSGMTNSEDRLFYNINALPVGANCSIQLHNPDIGDSNLVGFTVPGDINQPIITVLSPNGGETLVQGKQALISWKGRGLSGVFADLAYADGKGSLGVIGYVDSKYTYMGWDPKVVWTSLNNGKEIPVPPGNYRIHLVGNLADVPAQVVSDVSDSYFKIVSSVEPVKPTVTLRYKTLTEPDFVNSDSAVLPVGTEVLLQWSSTNAKTCTASANPPVSTWTGVKSTDGLGSVGQIDIGRTYTLSCTGDGGSAVKSINVHAGPSNPPPTKGTTVTMGESADGTNLACNTRKINLAWTPIAGAVLNNIRVDDMSNPWGGKSGGLSWCKGYDGGGDLCENGNTTTYRADYPVQNGRTYHFWMDSTDKAGKVLSSRTMNFTVKYCSSDTGSTTPPEPKPIVTTETVKIGDFNGGSLSACTIKTVNLAWTPVAGAVHNNIRVDDLSNPWGGKSGGLSWCKGYDGEGDLCENSLTGTTRGGYSVQSGHSYKFWIDSTDDKGTGLSSRSVNFSVPNCASAAAVENEQAGFFATVLSGFESLIDSISFWK